jgi:hypothetical protein
MSVSVRKVAQQPAAATNTHLSAFEAYGADNLARYYKLRAEIVVSSENTLFAISPKMSNPPKEFTAADPDFWVGTPGETRDKPGTVSVFPYFRQSPPKIG